MEGNRPNRLPSVISQFPEDQAERLPFNALSLSNTNSGDYFSRTCREKGITRHPATMHPGLMAFFTNFLTDEEDLILDPFCGSNTAGYVAERLQRKWIG